MKSTILMFLKHTLYTIYFVNKPNVACNISKLNLNLKIICLVTLIVDMKKKNQAFHQSTFHV